MNELAVQDVIDFLTDMVGPVIGLDRLAYNAWTGNRTALDAVDGRLRCVLAAC